MRYVKALWNVITFPFMCIYWRFFMYDFLKGLYCCIFHRKHLTLNGYYWCHKCDELVMVSNGTDGH